MRLVKDYLPRAFADGTNIEARAHMMSVAAMGATAFQKGLGGDLPRVPSFITGVCGSGFHILRFGFGQVGFGRCAGRERGRQIAQAPGVLLRVFCCRAASAA